MECNDLGYGRVKDIYLMTSRGFIRLPYETYLLPIKIKQQLRKKGFNIHECINWLDYFYSN